MWWLQEWLDSGSLTLPEGRGPSLSCVEFLQGRLRHYVSCPPSSLKGSYGRPATHPGIVASPTSPALVVASLPADCGFQNGTPASRELSPSPSAMARRFLHWLQAQVFILVAGESLCAPSLQESEHWPNAPGRRLCARGHRDGVWGAGRCVLQGPAPRPSERFPWGRWESFTG